MNALHDRAAVDQLIPEYERLRRREAVWNDLTEWAPRLHAAKDREAIAACTAEAIQKHTRYTHCWLYYFEQGEPQMARMVFVRGDPDNFVPETHGAMNIEDDEMFREIRRSLRPVIVEDARNDKRVDPAVVEGLGIRTIINVPLILIDRSLGTLGAGTFEQEGVLPPTAEEVWAMEQIASHAGVAVGRIEFEEERERGLEDRRRLQAQFLQAQKLESMGLLAGGVAHDVNNMLVGVLGNATLAREEAPSTPELAEYFDAIETAATRASELSNQLLTYSGRATFKPLPVDLGALVTEMVSLMRATIPRKVHVDVRVPADRVILDGDASQLRQLVMNLMTNGAQSIDPERGGTLELEVARCRSARGQGVLLRVKDSGCGMSDEVRSRIFDPFFTTKPRGRGLGMAAVLGIVRGHDADIEVESTEGAGSTFRIRFPASAATELRSVVAAEPVRRDRLEGRVLVVDDEALVRRLVRRYIEGEGMVVEEVCDGFEAITELERGPERWAAIVLDLSMPGMTGIETYEKVRTLAPTLPVLLMSGGRFDASAATAQKDPAVRFLAKPFRSAELFGALRALLASPAASTSP